MASKAFLNMSVFLIEGLLDGIVKFCLWHLGNRDVGLLPCLHDRKPDLRPLVNLQNHQRLVESIPEMSRARYTKEGATGPAEIPSKANLAKTGVPVKRKESQKA